MIRIKVYERIGIEHDLLAILIVNPTDGAVVNPIVLPATDRRPNAMALTTLDIMAEFVPDETHEPEPINVEQGVEIHASETARYPVSMLIREGCSGSPYCAAEIYACKGDNYIGLDTVDAHLSDDELKRLYQAVKAVRKARKGKRL